MTHPRRSDDPNGLEEFERALESLVSGAEESGIDIEGAYDVRTPWGDRSDYTIEITVIRKRVPGADDTGDTDE